MRFVCAVLLTGLICSLKISAQNFSPEDFKVALVGQFIKNIEWPHNDAELSIIVPQDRNMLSTLSVLDGEVIEGKRISVSFASDISNLPDADLVYISKEVIGNLDNVLALMRGKGTLVVTENSPTLHNVMINIVDNSSAQNETYRLNFQINRPNIVFEQLTIDPELILFGGTELDVATLYRETETAMQSLRDENLQTLQELEQKRQELNEQQAKLLGLESNFSELEDRLKASQEQLNKQQKALAETNQKLANVNSDYVAAKEDSEQKLSAAKADVEEQIRILSSLEQQVAQTNSLLEVKDAELQAKDAALEDTSERLIEKTEEVQQQAEVIDKQFVIIITIAISLLVFTIMTLIVAKMFFKNRSITRELEATVATLKDAQEQLIESEKLASLGQMVAGVAHEINTPIGVVVTSSSKIGEDAATCLKKLEDKSLKRSEMERFLTVLVETDRLIQSNLERCSNLIQNFKQVSADQVVAENRDIHLQNYIHDVMTTLSVVMKRNKVTWKVTGDNPTQNLDPGLLSQVINNLTNNAINHAFGDNENPAINIEIKSIEGYDQIKFTDNGRGMDEVTKKKIFDPFFTTKRGSGGTGLGMNIVYNLVTSKLQGTVSVDSELNVGTTITIELPSNIKPA